MELLFKNEVNILVIDDNNAPFILPLIRSFSGHSNIHLDVLVFSKEKPHLFRYSKYLRNVYHLRKEIHEHFEEGIRDTIERSGAQLIIPTREWISQLISKHQTWLSEIVRIHPVSDEDTLDMVTDKWKLNQWLKAHHFPYAQAIQLNDSPSELSDSLEISYPFLIKPRKGAGGIGIKLIRDQSEFQKVTGMLDNSLGDHLLQEYIEGSDIDISLFSKDGEILFYTMQRGISNGSFAFPRGIEFIKSPALFNLVKQIITKLGYTGVAHLDFRFDTNRNRFILVDFNARYWNSVQGSRMMGVNFPLIATAYSMDFPVAFPDYTPGYFYYGSAAIRQVLKNLTTRQRHPVRFKSSQLHSIVKDPLPELLYLLRRPFSSIL